MAGGTMMQAIIMAAGKGSRLGTLTMGKPKSFAEIHGKKLIEYNLKLLQKYQVEDIIIVTGYNCEAFEELTKDMEHVRLIYNPFYEMVNVLGSFYMGMEALKDDFIYLHADTICEPSIFEKLIYIKKEVDILLPVDERPCDEEAMKVRSEQGRIVQITKQMPIEHADGEFIGMAAFRKEVIPALKAKTKELLKEKKFNEYFESAIQRLLEEEHFQVKTVPTEGAFWAEIDFMEDYQRAAANMPSSLLELFL
jgi:choline kinase